VAWSPVTFRDPGRWRVLATGLLLVSTWCARAGVVATADAHTKQQDADGQDHHDEADDPDHLLPA
jgi:hypothetical protein